MSRVTNRHSSRGLEIYNFDRPLMAGQSYGCVGGGDDGINSGLQVSMLGEHEFAPREYL